jgi:hypothetical protein
MQIEDGLTVGADPARAIVILKGCSKAAQFCIDALLSPEEADTVARAFGETGRHLDRNSGQHLGARGISNTQCSVTLRIPPGSSTAELALTELSRGKMEFQMSSALLSHLAGLLEAAAAHMRAQRSGEIALPQVSAAGRDVGKA